MPGQNLEAAGGQEDRPLEFHKKLGDERVHPLKELQKAFKLFEDHEHWKRTTAPEMKLNAFLTHEENQQWGAVKYELSTRDSNQERISLYLNYSPWMYHDKDILLSGRVVLEGDVTEFNINMKELDSMVKSVYFEVTGDGNEIYSLTLPEDFEESLAEMFLDRVTDTLSHLKISK
jgi:hypothetical protein